MRKPSSESSDSVSWKLKNPGERFEFGFFNFQLTNTITWLWRWLPHRLSKRQSLTTVLLRTPITQMIFFNQGMLYSWVQTIFLFTYLCLRNGVFSGKRIYLYICIIATKYKPYILFSKFSRTWKSFFFCCCFVNYGGALLCLRTFASFAGKVDGRSRFSRANPILVFEYAVK